LTKRAGYPRPFFVVAVFPGSLVNLEMRGLGTVVWDIQALIRLLADWQFPTLVGRAAVSSQVFDHFDDTSEVGRKLPHGKLGK